MPFSSPFTVIRHELTYHNSYLDMEHSLVFGCDKRDNQPNEAVHESSSDVFDYPSVNNPLLFRFD